MRAQRITAALCGIGEGVHAALRDIQRRMDADRDPRFGLVERQLISVLQDVDYLIGVLEQQALEELMAEIDGEAADDP
jgi:hypothetical protein